MFFSLMIVAAQRILKVNSIFNYIGIYLALASMVVMLSGLYRLPGLTDVIRELLIIQRITSLLAGFPLVSIVLAISKDILKTYQIRLVYLVLSLLIIVALVDLIGNFEWLFLAPPPAVNPTLMFRIVYLPFSYIALIGSFLVIFIGSRKLSGDSKKIVNTLVAGMFFIIFTGVWEYMTMSSTKAQLTDTISFANPGLLIMTVFIFIFIIRFIKLHIKYKYSGNRTNKAHMDVLSPDSDHELYVSISNMCKNQGLYAKPDIDIGSFAASIGQPGNIVSRVINKYSSGNFNFYKFFQDRRNERTVS
jgi:hypothetical protein